GARFPALRWHLDLLPAISPEERLSSRRGGFRRIVLCRAHALDDPQLPGLSQIHLRARQFRRRIPLGKFARSQRRLAVLPASRTEHSRVQTLSTDGRSGLCEKQTRSGPAVCSPGAGPLCLFDVRSLFLLLDRTAARRKICRHL